jgi:hypothetical protein
LSPDGEKGTSDGRFPGPFLEPFLEEDDDETWLPAYNDGGEFGEQEEDEDDD